MTTYYLSLQQFQSWLESIRQSPSDKFYVQGSNWNVTDNILNYPTYYYRVIDSNNDWWGNGLTAPCTAQMALHGLENYMQIKINSHSSIAHDHYVIAYDKENNPPTTYDHVTYPHKDCDNMPNQVHEDTRDPLGS